MSYDNTEFLQRYKQEERDFVTSAKKASKEPFEVEHSTETQDKLEHWDVKFTTKSKAVTFDVKAMKRNNRSDAEPNPDIQWIEIKGVYGHEGWIYGKADYIVFEQPNDWILVMRKDLVRLMGTLVTDTKIYNSKQMYKKYQRAGRQDEIVLIKTADLSPIIKKRLRK